jgi:hypothetical protein
MDLHVNESRTMHFHNFTGQPSKVPPQHAPVPPADLPALLTPAQAAGLLDCHKGLLPSLPLTPIHVRSRGIGVRRHLRYRLAEVLAFRHGGVQ